VALLLVAWAFVCRAATKEARMDEAAVGKLERVYVGRFSLEVPVGAARYGEEFLVRNVALTETSLASADEKGWRLEWAARRAAVEGLKASRVNDRALNGRISLDLELEPGRYGVMVYHHASGSAMVTVLSLRRVDGVGLWMMRVAGGSSVEAVRARMAAVGPAYHPVTREQPRPTGDVFHLPHGVIAAPFQDQEKAKSIFKGGPLGLEINLFTQTTDEPKGGGLLARFAGAVANAGVAFAAGASPVRSRGRTAAGMKGEEFVMRDSKEGNLYFMWEFKGEAGSGKHPRIQLQMITKQERQQEKMAAWDALVDSLKPAAAP
jgi:hypothetical protein